MVTQALQQHNPGIEQLEVRDVTMDEEWLAYIKEQVDQLSSLK
jgi:hypothetical protein